MRVLSKTVLTAGTAAALVLASTVTRADALPTSHSAQARRVIQIYAGPNEQPFSCTILGTSSYTGPYNDGGFALHASTELVESASDPRCAGRLGIGVRLYWRRAGETNTDVAYDQDESRAEVTLGISREVEGVRAVHGVSWECGVENPCGLDFSTNPK